MNKYNAKKLTINGETFDSKREYNRWLELNLLLKAGRINNLKRQEVYELLPNQYNCGQLIERSVKYKADFVYEENNKVIVEDCKGARTPEYIIKRKLMLYIHGIRIKET